MSSMLASRDKNADMIRFLLLINKELQIDIFRKYICNIQI